MDSLGNRFFRTGKYKVINLSYKVDSFSSILVDRCVYSSIMGSSSETNSLQDLVDEVLPKST